MPPLPPDREDDQPWSRRDAFGKKARREETSADRRDPWQDPAEQKWSRFDAGLGSVYRVMLVLFVAVLVIFYALQLIDSLRSGGSAPIPRPTQVALTELEQTRAPASAPL